MRPSFVAIDFETANRHRASACSVGLVRVRDGEIVATDHWLMRPPVGFDHFEERNIAVHGIRPRMVSGQPRFAETYDRLRSFVGSDVLVAHNAAFDMQVAAKATVASGLREPTLRSICTRDLSKRLLILCDYTLPTVTAHFGIDLANHHDALADSLAAARVMIALTDLPNFAPSTVPGGHGMQLFPAGNRPADRAHPQQHLSAAAD